MDSNQAKEILGVETFSDKSLLKKQYRKLMHLVHPDNGEYDDSIYPYSAKEINAAYTFLKSLSEDNEVKIHRQQAAAKRRWNAPVNKNAFCARQIFDEVVDSEGEQLGTIEIARDKYIWILDEEFSLFLKSIYVLSKNLLDEIDYSFKREPKKDYALYQAELTYKLAQQFVDSTQALFDLGMDVENNEVEDTFYVPAMLETDINSKVTNKIYPLGVKNHRLYVANIMGENIGYLSFDDSRLSFILTPLFEQKDIKVKLEVAHKQNKTKSKLGRHYVNIDMWIKVPFDRKINKLDNTNMQIKKILEAYKK